MPGPSRILLLIWLPMASTGLMIRPTPSLTRCDRRQTTTAPRARVKLPNARWARFLTLAQEHSLAGKMSSNQAYYVQGWVVGAVAIAYLKIRETGIATPEQTEAIANWMQRVGEQTIGYYAAHKRVGHGDIR
jgi:hypothetical protein